jgi:uncharacterized protein
MALDDEKYIRFTTYKRDGTAVSTPTWIVALDGGRFGFWTSSGSGKAKRLAHTARVTLQPSDARGRVKAGTEPVDATAELVTGAQLAEITTKVKAKYGFVTHITKLVGEIVGVVKRNRIPYGDRGVVIELATGDGAAT